MNDEISKQAKQYALDCLARREYARLELRRKLLHKGFEAHVIDQVLIQLQANCLLSDERFLENFVRTRTNQGYGPLRIQQECQQRGLTKEFISETLDIHNTIWIDRAREVCQKKFGHTLPHDAREKMKQMRFLQYRGFTNTQIRAVLTETN